MQSIVLVADGDTAQRDTYEIFLRRLGYEVETTSDALGCLEKLRRLKPTALVLDWGLLWGGGAGVVELLRDEPGLAETRVVLTATAEHTPDLERVRPPGVQFLAKPFPLLALLESIGTTPEARDTHPVLRATPMSVRNIPLTEKEE